MLRGPSTNLPFYLVNGAEAKFTDLLNVPLPAERSLLRARPNDSLHTCVWKTCCWYPHSNDSNVIFVAANLRTSSLVTSCDFLDLELMQETSRNKWAQCVINSYQFNIPSLKRRPLLRLPVQRLVSCSSWLRLCRSLPTAARSTWGIQDGSLKAAVLSKWATHIQGYPPTFILPGKNSSSGPETLKQFSTQHFLDASLPHATSQRTS